MERYMNPRNQRVLSGYTEEVIHLADQSTEKDDPFEGIDPAIQPNHYLQFKIEPIRFGVENYGRGVLVTKILKYVQRAPFKNGAQDLAKAARCLEMLTKFDAGDPEWWRRTV
jgi:hypothetical protein